MIRTTMVVAGLLGAGLLVGVAGPAVAETAGSAASAGSAVSPVSADAGVRTLPTSGPGMLAATQLPASPMPAAPVKRTALTLSYAADAGYAAAIKLGCDPATGLHPEKKQACAVLKKVSGRPDRLTPARTMCMMIYQPVRADITGTWKGRRVKWSKTYGNKCEMNRATGVLFAF
jgi:hypothetical protein